MVSNTFSYTLTEDLYFLGEKENGVIPKHQNIIISKYLPPVLLQIFNMVLKKKPDMYLLCPYYQDQRFQIGVTGSFKVDENRKDAMKREILEETRLICDDPDILLSIETPNKYWYLGSYTRYKFKRAGVVEEPLRYNDDKSKKIGALIWCDLNDILKHPSIDLIESDDIVGLGLIHASEIELILKRLHQYIK